MSTRSTIGLERTNGEVTAIYCHFDGYLDGVGKMLEEHYKDITKVRDLIALGGISSLDREIGEKHLFDMDPGVLAKLGWTNAYHRDRGEDFDQTRFPSRKEMLQDMQEYTYLFSEKKNCWYWCRYGSKKMTKLTEKSRDK